MKTVPAAEIVELPGWRRHAARFALPGWRERNGRYTLAEGFSEHLAMALLSTGPDHGLVLDPFAGAGTTLLAAARSEWSGMGIEMMPLGRFLVDSYTALDDLGDDATEALADMPAALDGISDPIEALEVAMLQASCLNGSSARLAGAFATLCTMDILRRQDRLPFYRLATPMEAMGSVCSRLARLAPEAYLGISECPMVEGDCRTALRKMPVDKFDMVITSPPFFGRWDGGADYELEHDIVELASVVGCYRPGGLRPALRWRDDGLGEIISAQLDVQCVSAELREHCRMLGWLLGTSAGVLKKGGAIHIVLENPALEGKRRALDEAVSFGAEMANLSPDGITRLPSQKEMALKSGLCGVSLVSLRK